MWNPFKKKPAPQYMTAEVEHAFPESEREVRVYMKDGNVESFHMKGTLAFESVDTSLIDGREIDADRDNLGDPSEYVAKFIRYVDARVTIDLSKPTFSYRDDRGQDQYLKTRDIRRVVVDKPVGLKTFLRANVKTLQKI